MKVVFTNCDFVLNHTKIIPFNCSSSPYFGNFFNAGIKEVEIYSPNGVIPENAFIASYISPSSQKMGNLQIIQGTTQLINVNLSGFSPAIDVTADEVTEHTASYNGYHIRIKGNFKKVQDAIDTVPALVGSSIQGYEQDGCFNWRID